jgi:hypothetical protein
MNFVLASRLAISRKPDMNPTAGLLCDQISYLRIVGPTYGFFGLGFALYFASGSGLVQGTHRRGRARNSLPPTMPGRAGVRRSRSKDGCTPDGQDAGRPAFSEFFELQQFLRQEGRPPNWPTNLTVNLKGRTALTIANPRDRRPRLPIAQPISCGTHRRWWKFSKASHRP